MITIGAPAVRAHLRHGDFIGNCENNNEGNETVGNETNGNITIPGNNESTNVSLPGIVINNTNGSFGNSTGNGSVQGSVA